ncbi:hypothetical protein sscle_03g030860 [Sclerotinia sclerotiorum 1980 UF-70]|uniref:Uncharacterized protein n=1 Tax=Sclerotinia sclerotiorum (strain ATCC 18683 / 1980 / Ss-1) TaxID=665079 RepID=A0A1D9Q079_SCLS1|nr:hypothetical protein sscle_03g030860 [Sclerotinia sclerotiorum 1980 UF-70]
MRTALEWIDIQGLAELFRLPYRSMTDFEMDHMGKIGDGIVALISRQQLLIMLGAEYLASAKLCQTFRVTSELSPQYHQYHYCGINQKKTCIFMPTYI